MIKQYGCFKLVYFAKQTGCLSSAGTKTLAFGGHSMANFQSILDCFIPNFKLKHEDLENIKTDCVSTVVFQLTSNQTSGVFMGHPIGSTKYAT